MLRFIFTLAFAACLWAVADTAADSIKSSLIAHNETIRTAG